MITRKVKLATPLLLVFTALIIVCAIHFSREKTYPILVIHSYAADMPSYPNLNEKIVTQFEENGINADVRTVYLDCERYSEKPEINHMIQLINGTMRDGWKPALIIANNDQAVYSLLMSGHSITRSVPIVFGGVQYPNYGLLRKFKNVTGFVDKIDVMHNLEFIKRVMGNSTAIYTPIDDSFLGCKVLKDVTEQLKGQLVAGKFTMPYLNADKVRQLNEKHGYTIYDNYSIEDNTKRKMEYMRLIPQIRVFTTNFSKLKNGDRFWLTNLKLNNVAHLIYKYDKFSELLLKLCPNPIFTASNSAFGFSHNVLGGYMTTLYMQVDDEVDAATKILKGESIAKIPITQSSKMYAVDWNAVKAFNINPGRLPKSCVILNQPFRERYPLVWTLAVVVAVLVFIFLVSLYVYEVKKRRQMNVMLRQQHNMLKLSLSAANAFAWYYKEGYFTFDDSFWASMGNIRPHPISIEELGDMILPEHRHLLAEAKDNITSDNEGGTIQMQIRFNDEYQWWKSRYFIAENYKDKNAFYGLSFNIEQTKKHEKELEELRRMAEKAEMKQSFLENINHEIRTPLNSIVGFSHILATDDTLSDEDRDKYLDLVDSNNDKLLHIIDNILFISQLESGEIKMNVHPVRVGDIINAICQSSKNFQREDVQLIEEMEDDECLISVDEQYAERAILHLVENGLKFTDRGYVKIGYLRNSTDKTIEIYVEDTGRGIGFEEKDIVYSHFYKHNRFDDGTGLGLTITKLIIDKLGGNIDFQSEIGKGTRFTITFPCTNTSVK